MKTSTKAWCEKCCHYHPSSQRKTTNSLPHILCLAAGSARTNPDLWRAPIPQKLTVRLTPVGPNVGPNDGAQASHTVSVGEYIETDILSENDHIFFLYIIFIIIQNNVFDNGVQLYELVAVISHISDPSKKSPKMGHIVAQIRVPPSELPGKLIINNNPK